MIILGINYIYHDSTACVVKDGKLIASLEEERLNREKHTYAFPKQAIARCLEIAGLTAEEIDHIAISFRPDLERPRKIAYALKLGWKTRAFSSKELGFALFATRAFRLWFDATFTKDRKPEVHFVPHHLSHAAGSFFVSPYESAALLSLDGWGEWATTFKGVGRGTTVECFAQDLFPYSLGAVYEVPTDFCGFRTSYDEGKTMGLAPLGNPDTFSGIVEKIFWVNEDMSIGVDLSYFDFQHYGPRCSKKFYETFGQARQKTRDARFEQHHLDVAAAFQKQLEECVLKIARQLRERTQEDYLVISGGVTLNSVANGRLVRESGFEDLYVMPAAGDNGTAIGAAYYLYNSILGQPRTYVHDDPYVGTGYGNGTIQKLLEECKLEHRYLPDGQLEAVTARLLQSGQIVGWFQGRMEIGPRALGNRSILANPTLPDMKDKINAEVKHREAFRPFAPSCPVEDTPQYFEQHVADPFMLKVCRVRPEKQAVIPAVTHVDGTARLQTVHRETNPRFHRLLKEFEKLTGVPVLLNTSFNVMGEPIVESPQDAIRCFFSTGLDYLVLGNYVVGKQPGMLPDVPGVRAFATSRSPPISLDREAAGDPVPLPVAGDQPCLLRDRETVGRS
ncbi:carbamoyltransferase [Methanoculleus sp. Wushi-C6]|uniref:Carbamoyltransferase n=1 Tax=Methanoculleus caldifontis TaxID=2651577 RepID=A0ABU3WZ37_9EURY|nr:carbamoyltransferase C-terminal domain-containing protein [Methanoculleus sp. Wushi-C6]MDV2481063.1 carbamoyltransferase [Methanoculleus sp. Wushi-C6]